VLGSAGAGATQQDTLWSVRTGNNEVKDCHFTPSGDSVIAVAGDTLYILETSTGNILKKSQLPYVITYFRMFHNSGKFVGINYSAATMIWDYEADSLVDYVLPSITTSTLDLNSDDSKLYIGVQRFGNKILVYNINKKEFIDSIPTTYAPYTLAISPDGMSVAYSSLWTISGHDYGELILVNTSTKEIIKDFDPIDYQNTQYGTIKDIRFSPDGKYIGIAKWDGTVKVYRADSLDLYRNFIVYGPNSGYGPVRICFTNNSQYIYSSLMIMGNYTTKLWDIEKNELLFTYNCVSGYGLDVNKNENILTGSGYFINLLAPKWLSVDDEIQKHKSNPSYIISKSSGNNIRFDDGFKDCINYELFDYFGNTVITGKNCSEINPENLACGLYFLKINAGKESRVIKIFIVE
jgi:WD40 repeat protein